MNNENERMEMNEWKWITKMKEWKWMNGNEWM